MTIPISTVTRIPSEHSVVVHFPNLDNKMTSYMPAALIESLDNMVFYTINGEADDKLFESGFAFAISIETFALFVETGTPEEVIEHLLTVFQLLGMLVFSYKESLVDNEFFQKNIEVIVPMYSARFFSFSTMLSKKTKCDEPLSTSCSCESSLPLLTGPWHKDLCPMYSSRSFSIRYETEPPCCSLIFSGQYGLEDITATLREGLVVITRTLATETPVFGNLIADLNSLAQTALIDYLIILGYKLDHNKLPARFVK